MNGRSITLSDNKCVIAPNSVEVFQILETTKPGYSVIFFRTKSGLDFHEEYKSKDIENMLIKLEIPYNADLISDLNKG